MKNLIFMSVNEENPYLSRDVLKKKLNLNYRSFLPRYVQPIVHYVGLAT